MIEKLNEKEYKTISYYNTPQSTTLKLTILQFLPINKYADDDNDDGGDTLNWNMEHEGQNELEHGTWGQNELELGVTMNWNMEHGGQN